MIEDTKSHFLQQPEGIVSIDWSNPLSRGLVSYVPLKYKNFKDLVKPLYWTAGYAAAMSDAVVFNGMGTKFGTSPSASYIQTPWTQSFLTKFTIAFWYRPASVSGATTGIISVSSDGNPTSGSPQILLQRNLATLRAYSNSVGYFVTTGSVLTAGKPHLCVFTYDGSSGTWYVDGNSSATASAAVSSASPTTIFVGSGYLNPINDPLQDFAFWYGRALSAEEVRSYYADPWQILRKPTKTIFPVISGGTQTYSYTATGGMALSGTAAIERQKIQSVSGGVQFGGSASVSFVGLQTLVVTPSGGLTFGGTATQSVTRPESASGGIQFGGSATVTTHESVRTVTPSGGIQFGGSAGVYIPSLVTLHPYRRFIYGRKGLLDRKISRQ